MGNDWAKQSFIGDLRRALSQLYDPGSLRASPLVEHLGIDRRTDPVGALRRRLIEAIEALRPAPGVPPQANAWRIYHVLSQRYVEQFTQKQVATDLALSIRQLRRLEHLALRELADYLRAHHLAPAEGPISPPRQSGGAAVGAGMAPSRQQELQWLQQSLPGEPALLPGAIAVVCKTVAPLAQALNVHVETVVSEDLPPLAVQPTTLRQALLSIITAAISRVPAGQVRVSAQARPQEVEVQITALLRSGAASPPAADNGEGLEMARQLLALSGASLDVASPGQGKGVLAVRLGLPIAGQVPVLVIDDNPDTLQLLQRYASGSRYQLYEVRDPQQALPRAAEVAPRIIILDVMLPGVDGWELLGRLREHPQTRGTPILVCTILPQERLALTLGAAGFLRKPVSREAFLAALDSQLQRRE